MRLICPQCAAQYEIEDGAIPAGGRAVECAACGHGWHQSSPPPAPRRPSESVLAILREEAAFSLAPRAEAVPGPDLAAVVDQATRRSTPPEALPDPAALAASLDWAPAAAAPAAPEPVAPIAVPAPQRPVRRSWDRGFSTAASLAALLLAGYMAAPPLAARYPAAAPLMQARASVDALRLGLQGRAERLTDAAIALAR